MTFYYEPIWRAYSRKGFVEMIQWHPDYPMDQVSVSEADKLAGSPKVGDMIARNPDNHLEQWLVAADYFLDKYFAYS